MGGVAGEECCLTKYGEEEGEGEALGRGWVGECGRSLMGM